MPSIGHLGFGARPSASRPRTACSWASSWLRAVPCGRVTESARPHRGRVRDGWCTIIWFMKLMKEMLITASDGSWCIPPKQYYRGEKASFWDDIFLRGKKRSNYVVTIVTELVHLRSGISKLELKTWCQHMPAYILAKKIDKKSVILAKKKLLKTLFFAKTLC